MNTSSTPINLREAIKSLDSLPTLPIIAQKLLALNTETDEGQRQLLVLVEQDPQILAKIIGLANSPMFGTSRKISSISEATSILGINKIKSVASGIAMMSIKSGTSTGSLKLQDLWMHNLGIAFAMLAIGRAMPRQIRPQDDDIFLAGMLHDIDICHDELGAELARYWNLPVEIISVIRYHHTPDAVEAPKDHPLIRMVYMAEKMLPSFGMNEQVDPGIHDYDWEALSISPANAEEILTQAAEQADQAALFAASLG